MEGLSIPIQISDPASAIAVAAMNCLTAFFGALVTPSGQIWWAQNNALVADMWGRLGVHIPGAPPAPGDVTVTKT